MYRKCRANERASLLGADRIVYVSEFMRTHLLGVVEGLHFRTSLVLPNFVFKPRRSADGAGGDLVTVGTLEPRKNHIFLLHMLAVAKRLGKHYTLTIFGIGVLDSFLRKSARDLGIEDQVIFAGYVTNAAEQLHRYRVYVHAAKIENLPISVIEALASGIPVIAAPVGGIPEILTEGSDGLFWNIEDPEAAAHVVIGLLEDETRRMQMGRAASERYELSFSAEKIAPELHRFLVGDERDAGDKPVGANHDTAQRETTGLLI